MRRVLYNNREYVFSRQRDGFIELVSVDDLTITKISETEAGVLVDVPRIDRLLVPDSPRFIDRPRDFVNQLQQQRFQHLLNSRNKRFTKSKLNPDGTPVQRKPRTAKASKANDMLQQLIAMSAKGKA